MCKLQDGRVGFNRGPKSSFPVPISGGSQLPALLSESDILFRPSWTLALTYTCPQADTDKHTHTENNCFKENINPCIAGKYSSSGVVISF